MRFLGFIIASCTPLLMAPSCGDSARAFQSEGGTCTRDRDCFDELVCISGICTQRGDAGPDASTADGSIDGSMSDASIDDASVDDASLDDASAD